MAETVGSAVERTTGAVGGGACDTMTATAGVRVIGGKPRCC